MLAAEDLFAFTLIFQDRIAKPRILLSKCTCLAKNLCKLGNLT